MASLAPLALGKVETHLERLTRWFAYFGGVVLTLMGLLTVVSIIGRALIPLGLGPVPGDFELVEIGCAVAIFSFLPYCHLKRGHVTVDILVDRFPSRIRTFLGLVGDVLIMLVSIVIAWRLWLGMGERIPFFEQSTRDVLGFGYKPFSVETTFILGLPVWYGYVLSMIAALLFVVTCLFAVWRSLSWTLEGREAANA